MEAINFRKFFTREALIKALDRLAPLKTPIMDLIYPEANRMNHPLPVVGYEDLGLPLQNIPVVRRGTASYGLKPESDKIVMIEPQPVNPSIPVDAVTLNNFKILDPTGQQALIDNRIDTLRRVCRATTEALCCQSLTGAINYPMRSDGGLLTYQVDFGSPQSVSIGTKWGDAGKKIGGIIEDLAKMSEKLKKRGYGSRIAYLAGLDVFSVLVEKAGALANQSLVIVSENQVTIGGVTIRLETGSYVDLPNGQSVPVVPPKNVLAVDLDAGHKLIYCAIDDLDANLQAMPFFVKPIKTDDPSGWRFVAESKPLPVPRVAAICTAQVLQ